MKSISLIKIKCRDLTKFQSEKFQSNAADHVSSAIFFAAAASIISSASSRQILLGFLMCLDVD
jgi:hypothetical protein